MSGQLGERFTSSSAATPLPQHGGSQGEYRRLGVLALVSFALMTCLAGLGDGPMLEDHESIVAQAARQIRQSGEWLIPRVGELVRVRKTPLGYWLTAMASAVVDNPNALPVTAYSARLPSALSGFLTCLTVCWLGRMLYGFRAGLVAGFVTAGSVGFILYSRNAQVDMTLTLFTALSFACFWRGVMHERPSRWAMALFYVCFAMAMMAKAPLPLATVGTALAVYWFVTLPLLQREPRAEGDEGQKRSLGIALQQWMRHAFAQLGRVPRLWIIPGGVLFVIVAGAWPAYVFTHVENAGDLWQKEYIARFTGEMSERPEPSWYYVPMVFALAAPFMLSLPEAFAAAFMRRYQAQRRGLAFALTWFVVGFIVLSVAAYKRPHYLISVMPAVSLLLAPVIDRLFFGRLLADTPVVRRACAVLVVVIGLASVVGIFVVRHELPTMLHVYLLVGGVTAGLWMGACLAFSGGRRMTSFALLNLGTMVFLLLGWPAAGSHIEVDPDAHAFARRMLAHGIRPASNGHPGDEIYLAAGRPNTAIEFYHGLRIRRLINELELAEMRVDRRGMDETVMREALKRIEQQLQRRDRPLYVALTVGQYGLFARNSEVPARVVFQMQGYAREPGDEMCVITQSWNTAEGRR